jgi:hypothetical protein
MLYADHCVIAKGDVPKATIYYLAIAHRAAIAIGRLKPKQSHTPYGHLQFLY